MFRTTSMAHDPSSQRKNWYGIRNPRISEQKLCSCVMHSGTRFFRYQMKLGSNRIMFYSAPYQKLGITWLTCMYGELSVALELAGFYRAMHFSAKSSIAIDCPSVRLSVCLSVTLVDEEYIGWKSWKLIARTISPTPWLFRTIPSPTPYGSLFPKIGVRNPHPKLQWLLFQERVKLQSSNLAST